MADSLERAVDPEDSLVNRLLRMMTTQAMSEALYFSTGALTVPEFYHYGTFHSKDKQRNKNPPVYFICIKMKNLFVFFRPGSGLLHTFHFTHSTLRRHGGSPPSYCSHR